MTTTKLAPKEARVFTAEDVLKRPDAVAWELVGGKLEKRATGSESSSIALVIARLLGNFIAGKKLGYLFGSDASYECFPDGPTKLRRADVSFVRRGRLPNEKRPPGQIKIAPDLVVEVISPGDRAAAVDKKIEEYLSAGVPLIWVVYPGTRKVLVHRPAGSERGTITELTADDEITGEDVLPGFACKVRQFFEED